MNYTNTLSRAWKITWNNKILWLFGFLASIGNGGGGGGGGGGGNGGNGGLGGGPGGNLPPNLERQLQEPVVIAVIIGLACVAFAVAVALFVLSIIGRGALIGGVRLADDNGKVAFGEAWSIGTRYFWRMLGIGLILVVASIVVGGVGVFTAVLGALTLGIGLICLLPILCVFVLALIPLSIVAHFAQFGIVIEDLSVMAAFRKSWEVLKNNIGPVIIFGVILLVIGGVAGLILAAPFVAIVIPTVLAFVINPERPNVALLVGSGLALLCYLPVAIVLGSILQTWTTSVWTLAYRQFTSNAPAAQLPPAIPSGPAPDAPTLVG